MRGSHTPTQLGAQRPHWRPAPGDAWPLTSVGSALTGILSKRESEEERVVVYAQIARTQIPSFCFSEMGKTM